MEMLTLILKSRDEARLRSCRTPVSHVRNKAVSRYLLASEFALCVKISWLGCHDCTAIVINRRESNVVDQNK